MIVDDADMDMEISGRATWGARGAIAPLNFRNCHIKIQ